MKTKAIASAIAVALSLLIWIFPAAADQYQHHEAAMMQKGTSAAAETQQGDISATETLLRHSNNTCPISGKPVNPNLFYDYKDEKGNTYGRIYVCCPNCLATVAENPAKYYNKVYREEKKVASESTAAEEIANQTCPVLGGKARSDIAIEYNGKKVYFCCPGCVGKFTAEPGKYLKKMEQQKTPKQQ
jgi:YHS domain-containing protein